MSSIPPIGLGDVSLLDFLQAVRSNAVTEVVGGGIVNATKTGNTITVTGVESATPTNVIYQGVTLNHVANGYYKWKSRVYDQNTGQWADGPYGSLPNSSNLILELNAVEHAPAEHLYPMWQVEGGQWGFFSGLGLFNKEQALVLGSTGSATASNIPFDCDWGSTDGSFSLDEACSDDDFLMGEPKTTGEQYQGVIRWSQVRTVYKEDGDETLYAYYREEHIDALGNLIYIGPEVRAVIDEPVACDINV